MPISCKAAAVLLSVCAAAGCGVSGPPVLGGVPPVIDMHTDLGEIGGSAVLAGPAGWTPAPSITTPVYRTSAANLLAAMQEILLAQPRTWLVYAHKDQQEASFIVRSRALNLPDIVVVQAVPDGEAASKAVILSRSRYDVLPYLGANEKRVRGLVKALDARFAVATP